MKTRTKAPLGMGTGILRKTKRLGKRQVLSRLPSVRTAYDELGRKRHPLIMLPLQSVLDQ